MLKSHLLVVDDSPMMLALLKDYLEMSGYKVTCEKSADQALAFLKSAAKGEVDTVISDIVMPGMPGVEFVKVVSEQYGIPTIVITAFSNVYPEQDLAKAGAAAVISKPFVLSTLTSHLKKLAENQKAIEGKDSKFELDGDVD